VKKIKFYPHILVQKGLSQHIFFNEKNTAMFILDGIKITKRVCETQNLPNLLRDD